MLGSMSAFGMIMVASFQVRCSYERCDNTLLGCLKSSVEQPETCKYTYIYIYIWRKKEREREIERECVCVEFGDVQA